jgi:hypothetical protein
MKIGEPIKELPPTARRLTRHAVLWAVVEGAGGGWIPVTCESQAQRRRLQSAAGSLGRCGRRVLMQTVSDVGTLTLYIRIAPEVK